MLKQIVEIASQLAQFEGAGGCDLSAVMLGGVIITQEEWSSSCLSCVPYFARKPGRPPSTISTF